MAAPTNITEIGSGVYCYAASLLAVNPPNEPAVLAARNGALYAIGWSSELFSGGTVYAYPLKSTDGGQTWERLDFSTRPSFNRGSNSTGPVAALSYDGSKIAVVYNAITTGSDTRTEIRIFDLDTEDWESGHAGASGAPVFTWFVDVVPVNTNFALIGRFNGEWVLTYTRLRDDGGVVQYDLQFAVYDPVGKTWTSADQLIATRYRMDSGSGTYKYNISHTALADDGFDHVWYDVTTWTTTNVYSLRHRTITGTSVSVEDESFTCDNGPVTGTLPNISLAAHSILGRPIRWTSQGKIVIPVGLYSDEASASLSGTGSSTQRGHSYAGIFTGTLGSSAPALSFERFGSGYSYQFAACERANGTLAVVYKNYLKTGTNAHAYMLATKTSAAASPVVNQYLDIAAISGYDPRSPIAADTVADWLAGQFTPSVNANHFFICPYPDYSDRIAFVASLNREISGTPFPLHSFWGESGCCCYDYAY